MGTLPLENCQTIDIIVSGNTTTSDFWLWEPGNHYWWASSALFTATVPFLDQPLLYCTQENYPSLMNSPKLSWNQFLLAVHVHLHLNISLLPARPGKSVPRPIPSSAPMVFCAQQCLFPLSLDLLPVLKYKYLMFSTYVKFWTCILILRSKHYKQSFTLIVLCS
jgi:hypothetical protein